MIHPTEHGKEKQEENTVLMKLQQTIMHKNKT